MHRVGLCLNGARSRDDTATAFIFDHEVASKSLCPILLGASVNM